jgi:hypothetical protein
VLLGREGRRFKSGQPDNERGPAIALLSRKPEDGFGHSLVETILEVALVTHVSS